MDIKNACRYDKYILVITGFCYTNDSSGTSKVVKAHEEIYNEAGCDYIAIHPIVKHIPGQLGHKVIHSGFYGVVINGHYLGIAHTNDFINELASLSGDCVNPIGILVHHVIFNDMTDVTKIVSGIPNAPVVYYLHDFYSYCVNPKMLKNDKLFCAYEAVDCTGCIYQKDTQVHNWRMQHFFKTFADRLSFVSPAEFTKNVWTKLYPEYAHKVKVIPHLVSHGEYKDIESLTDDRPVRIAYVGAQAASKGWLVWKRFVENAIGNYELYYFGNGKEIFSNVVNYDVQIAKQGKNAMIDALRKHNIDVAVLSSICPETYSYTLYESIAADCYVLTTELSGNIATVVKAENRGKVCSDIDELIEYLCDEKRLRNDVMQWRKNKAPAPLYYDDNTQVLDVFDLDRQYAVVKTVAGVPIAAKVFGSALEVLYEAKTGLRRKKQ